MPRPLNQQGSQAGFTLIEILVVVVIIGVLLTATVALRGGHSDQRTLLAEAERLRSVFLLAQQAAAEQGLPLKLTVSANGYGFVRFNPIDGSSDGAQSTQAPTVSTISSPGLGLALLARQPEGQWQASESGALRDYRPEREFHFQLTKGRAGATDLLLPPDGTTEAFSLQLALVGLPDRVVIFSSDGLSAPDYALSADQ